MGTLAQVLTSGDTALVVTQVLRDEQDRAESLHTLYPQWNDAAAWPNLARHLAAIDASRSGRHRRLAAAAARRGLTNVADPTAVLDYRLRWATAGSPAAPLSAQEQRSSRRPLRPRRRRRGPGAGLRQLLAERIDARVDALGDRALQHPPAWLQRSGPVPGGFGRPTVDRLPGARRHRLLPGHPAGGRGAGHRGRAEPLRRLLAGCHPLSFPAIVPVVVFAFTLWPHEFIYARTSTPRPPTPLQRGRANGPHPRRRLLLAVPAGLSIIVAVPIALLFNLLLKGFITGFTMGAVKG